MVDQILHRLLRWARNEKALLGLLVAATLTVGFHELFRTRQAWQHYPRSQPAKFRPAVPVPTFFKQWRREFLSANEEEDRLGLVRGIFLGYPAAISERTTELFRSAGLSHLLAASGFNCWIVAMVFGLIATFLLGLLAPALSSIVSLKLQSVALPLSRLGGAWLFWLWTDQSPPITRCVITISTKFVLDLVNLSISFPRLLLVQYLISLIFLPRLFHSASFQLTYGCLYGILLFPKLVCSYRPREGKLRQALWDYLTAGLGACLGAFPTTALAFGTINFSSLTTNWFAVPLVSLLTMPLALAQMLLVPVADLPGLGIAIALLGKGAALSCDWLEWALRLWCELVPSLSFPRA